MATAAAAAYPIDLLVLSQEEEGAAMKRRLRNEETNQRRIQQRQRQINFGKCTAGYQIYLKEVPMAERLRSDPHTPRANILCAKRRWYLKLKSWRRALHKYDPPNLIEPLKISSNQN